MHLRVNHSRFATADESEFVAPGKVIYNTRGTNRIGKELIKDKEARPIKHIFKQKLSATAVYLTDYTFTGGDRNEYPKK
jgi:hypothetical protein